MIKRYDKQPRTEVKREDDGKLYYRISRKTGRIETNLLEWERWWKNVKILKYPTRYATELRLGESIEHGIAQILAANPMLPDVDTAREHWIPTEAGQTELDAIAQRPAREARLYLVWRQTQLQENPRRKALNEVAKTKIDLEVKAFKERGDTKSKIMGEVMEDMTRASRDRIEKFIMQEAEDEDEPRTLEDAREQGDWLFVFQAARETHMFQGITEDRVLMMYEKQEQEREYLARMKHVSGDLNRWIARFEDQVETCETIGAVITEEAKILYFMNNLNDTIFSDVKANFADLSTRALFPHTYDEPRRYGEASFKAEEDGCHICGVPGHFYKSFKHYNRKYSQKQNRTFFQKKRNPYSPT